MFHCPSCSRRMRRHLPSIQLQVELCRLEELKICSVLWNSTDIPRSMTWHADATSGQPEVQARSVRRTKQHVDEVSSNSSAGTSERALAARTCIFRDKDGYFSSVNAAESGCIRRLPCEHFGARQLWRSGSDTVSTGSPGLSPPRLCEESSRQPSRYLRKGQMQDHLLADADVDAPSRSEGAIDAFLYGRNRGYVAGNATTIRDAE
ncbi:hypothetical protein CERSUDRAFT_74479 [Gelatoporia subvermispora B]|uniref:Uncharacterized protein n=1 Tax=Ceriporiopsis subvermispora (strain B) TaxID=914234 RepID=M2PJX9_CERS8|nr:hypothetical protein CERSUDRAFT_74479 [Gelatoporia subvermispora B]